ncbi:endonuclease III [Candidatus Pacearchaeota archaeon]|nr:endonuclease III [Candidatus Pacearchaeota archaeon]
MDFKRAKRQLSELKRLGEDMRLAAEDWGAEWKCLIATIMSAQSRDETTIPIAESLFSKYNSLDKLAKASYADVLKVFSGLNFNKTKAKNVIACASELIEKYNGRIPHDLDKLIELAGVGRKTANVFLSEYGKDAIGVDTHLAYISKKLGWTKNTNPHKIEEDLKNLFPKKVWSKVNPTVVRFGKRYTSRKLKDQILDEINKIG